MRQMSDCPDLGILVSHFPCHQCFPFLHLLLLCLSHLFPHLLHFPLQNQWLWLRDCLLHSRHFGLSPPRLYLVIFCTISLRLPSCHFFCPSWFQCTVSLFPVHFSNPSNCYCISIFCFCLLSFGSTFLGPCELSQQHWRSCPELGSSAVCLCWSSCCFSLSFLLLLPLQLPPQVFNINRANWNEHGSVCMSMTLTPVWVCNSKRFTTVYSLWLNVKIRYHYYR